MNLNKKNTTFRIFIYFFLSMIIFNGTGCSKYRNRSMPIIVRNTDYISEVTTDSTVLNDNQFLLSDLKSPYKVEVWLEYYEDGLLREKLSKTEEFSFSKKNSGEVAIGLTETLIQEDEDIRFEVSINDSTANVTVDNYYSKLTSSVIARIEEVSLREFNINSEEATTLVSFYAGEEAVGNKTVDVFDDEYIKNNFSQVYFLKLKCQRLPVN